MKKISGKKWHFSYPKVKVMISFIRTRSDNKWVALTRQFYTRGTGPTLVLFDAKTVLVKQVWFNHSRVPYSTTAEKNLQTGWIKVIIWTMISYLQPQNVHPCSHITWRSIILGPGCLVYLLPIRHLSSNNQLANWQKWFVMTFPCVRNQERIQENILFKSQQSHLLDYSPPLTMGHHHNRP